MLMQSTVKPNVEVISAVALDTLDEIIDRYSGEAEYLIPALKDAQDLFGYLPPEVQHRLALGLGITPSRVFGVVTFYSFFTTVPRGRHTVRVCQGTACYVKGGKNILDNVMRDVGIRVGETTADKRFTIDAVRCLGTCGLAPVMVVDRDTYGDVNPKRSIQILQRYE